MRVMVELMIEINAFFVNGLPNSKCFDVAVRITRGISLTLSRSTCLCSDIVCKAAHHLLKLAVIERT